jgi:excisionase family DNA binding protein
MAGNLAKSHYIAYIRCMDELTTRQVAERLHRSPGHVRKLVEQGRLTPTRLHPRLLLFDAADVERYAATVRPVGRPRKTPAEGADNAE